MSERKTIEKLIENCEMEIGFDKLRMEFFQRKVAEGKDKNFYLGLLSQCVGRIKLNNEFIECVKGRIKNF